MQLRSLNQPLAAKTGNSGSHRITANVGTLWAKCGHGCCSESVDIEAVIARLGEVFTPDEAAIAERMHRLRWMVSAGGRGPYQ